MKERKNCLNVYV